MSQKMTLKYTPPGSATSVTLPQLAFKHPSFIIARKIEEVKSGSTITYRFEEPNNFQFCDEVKEDFKCPICKDIPWPDCCWAV